MRPRLGVLRGTTERMWRSATPEGPRLGHGVAALNQLHILHKSQFYNRNTYQTPFQTIAYREHNYTATARQPSVMSMPVVPGFGKLSRCYHDTVNDGKLSSSASNLASKTAFDTWTLFHTE